MEISFQKISLEFRACWGFVFGDKKDVFFALMM